VRGGREVRYVLVDPDVMVACGLMRSVLERRLARLGAIGAGAGSRAISVAPLALHSASR